MPVDISVIKNKRSRIKNPVFSILIPSWNNLPYLKLCIGSIRKNARYDHQIIVHINESTDGTLSWVETETDLDYTYSKTNIGICFALNIARSLADAEYILYLNDDMYICPGWDLALYTEITAIGHRSFFLSSTMIEPLDTGNQCVIVKDYGRDFGDFREQDLLAEFAGLPKTDWQGATWPPNIVHRDLWDLVGGYSIEFSPGMNSDPDFSMKLWKAGVRLYKGVSKSRVYHFGCKSTGRIKQDDGPARFFAKWQMPSSVLSRYYLRRGKPFDGPLNEPVLPRRLVLKNFYKKISALLRG